MKNNRIVAFTTIAILWMCMSCDDDFNSVGSEVIGGVGFEEKNYIVSPLVYNNILERVQTSGLPNNVLGSYEDPLYGTSDYAVLSQVLPDQLDFTFSETDTLDTVILNLPYFSTVASTSTEGNEVTRTYTLDSVYGSGPLQLSVYRSNYFLRDFDPNSEPEFQDRQIYYSDDIGNFGAEVASELITTTVIEPSAEELEILAIDGTDENNDLDTVKVAPRIRVPLSKELFTKWILEKAGGQEFTNPNFFFNYFRGIYLKTEPAEGSSGYAFAVNLADADITLRYGTKDSIPDKELKFNFTNNSINGITNDFDIAIPEPDTENGDESLYLKGGEGSYAVIELFNRYVETDADGEFVVDGNGNPVFRDTPQNPTENDKTELDFIISQNWLVNNCILKLYVDREKLTVGGDTEPERIFIFNAETGRGLIDFCGDPTSATNNPDNAALIHLGRLNRGSDERGEFYEINLTRHLTNLLNGSTENVKLGISVTQNVLAEVQDVERCLFSNPAKANDDKNIPSSSVISPEGTVLYGNTENIPTDKRLRLEILYSKSTRTN